MLMDINGHTILSEDYVSFEVAKLLQEKGFQEPCTGLNKLLCKEGKKPLLLITHQKAMKWLREIYGIDIVIEISDPSVKDRKYYCMIWDGNNNSYILDLFGSYEEAVEAALKYALENLI